MVSKHEGFEDYVENYRIVEGLIAKAHAYVRDQELRRAKLLAEVEHQLDLGLQEVDELRGKCLRCLAAYEAGLDVKSNLAMLRKRVENLVFALSGLAYFSPLFGAVSVFLGASGLETVRTLALVEYASIAFVTIAYVAWRRFWLAAQVEDSEVKLRRFNDGYQRSLRALDSLGGELGSKAQR